MDEKNIKFASEIIHPSYATLGYNSIQKRQKILKELLTQRQLPEQGLDELSISYILDELALMDSNNFHEKIGVGEREARIFSGLVQRRNFYMGHGIGRSGDVMANQPKAAGSSLLLQLCRFLTLSALKELNYELVEDVLLLPMATGMGLAMAFLTLAELRPDRKYVIWSRIDQKTCLKSIKTANLHPIVIQQKISGDALVCDHEAIEKAIEEVGADKILCIVSTTSCFAPRVPDDVGVNSQLAKKHGLFHVVNNAYGLWCTKIASQIAQGIKKGECTFVVQSTDKNFMVPVGGSIVFAQQPAMLQKMSAKYPGRASGSPTIDLFITLLSMGKSSIRELKKSRKQLFAMMGEKAEEFAKNNGFKLLSTKANTISMAMSLHREEEENLRVTELGGILYSKRVMGHRVIAPSEKQTQIVGETFSNYGSHHEKYPFLPYITFACAVGTRSEQIEKFFTRLAEALKELTKKTNSKCKKALNTEQSQQNKTDLSNEDKQEAPPLSLMMGERELHEIEDEEEPRMYD